MQTKIMILSDIHGGYYNLDKVLAIYEDEHFDRLFVLGDLFGYSYDKNDDRILERINFVEDSVLVRGNCDYGMNGEDIRQLTIEGVRFTLTHGNMYGLMKLVQTDTDIICVGHSHIPSIRRHENKYIINPGSVARSRQGENSFAVIEDGFIRLKTIDNVTFEEVKIENLPRGTGNPNLESSV